MLLKAGVDISRLNRQARRTLWIVSNIYWLNGDELVITSTYEGTHSPSSLHYHNDAFDVRLPVGIKPEDMVNKLKARLGEDFDIVLEADHIHIEYDPDVSGFTTARQT